jgi:hypothetical protein
LEDNRDSSANARPTNYKSDILIYEPMLPQSATSRYQFVVDGEYYSVRRAQQVTKEVTYANLHEMSAIDIAKYLGKRVVRRLKRTIGH